MSKATILKAMNDERRNQGLPENYQTDLFIDAAYIVECNAETFVWMLRTNGCETALCCEQAHRIKYNWEDERQEFYICYVETGIVKHVDKETAIRIAESLPVWDSLTHEIA